MRLLRVAVVGRVVIIVIVIFFAVFVFLLFLVWLLAKEDIGSSPRSGLAGIFGLAFVPFELLLKARLRIGSPLKRTHRNFKFPAAECADSKRRSGAQPFDNPKTALAHGQLFLGRLEVSCQGYIDSSPVKLHF